MSLFAGEVNHGDTYVLMTAARNEAGFIERTLRAVAAQTIAPAIWVIVSDGSTDETDSIVEAYAREFSFIRLVRIDRHGCRAFGSKVDALRQAPLELEHIRYGFIGNVDADVSLPRHYFEALIEHFRRDTWLGIAGGWVNENYGRGFEARPFNRTSSVPHAAQLVRRCCYESIGGYARLPHGGEDTCAAISAEMCGWKARSFPELAIMHHRITSSAGGICRSRFRTGLADWSLGYDLLYELLKCVHRASEYPYIVGTVLRLSGYIYGTLTSEPRPVSSEFVTYLRRSQRRQIRSRVNNWNANAQL